MGTDVAVVVTDTADDAGHAERLAEQGITRLAELERRWSRFLPDSEVSRLNGRTGRPMEVSADTVLLVRTALAAWRESAGLVDATELAAIIGAGYDRSFDLLPPDRPAHPAPTPSLLGPADIVVDGSTVTLPSGSGFDPGGIGKGLAADIVSHELTVAGATGVLVDVGGDLRVRGVAPEGAPGWTITVDHPHDPLPLARVGIGDGAIASSTTLRRRWRVGGRTHHHLIDPRTGAPAVTDIEFATAIAESGWRAEALAKAVLIGGGDDPFRLVDGIGAAALAVRTDGTVVTSTDWCRFTDEANRTRAEVAR